MFTVDQTILIRKPVEQVFDYLVNPINITQWRTDVLRIQNVSERVDVGSTFEEWVNFMGEKFYAMKVIEYTPNRREVVKAMDGPSVRPTQTFAFETKNGDTQVSVHVDVETRGLFRLMEPMFPNQFNKIWRQYLVNLKTTLESG